MRLRVRDELLDALELHVIQQAREDPAVVLVLPQVLGCRELGIAPLAQTVERLAWLSRHECCALCSQLVILILGLHQVPVFLQRLSFFLCDDVLLLRHQVLLLGNQIF